MWAPCCSCCFCDVTDSGCERSQCDTFWWRAASLGKAIVCPQNSRKFSDLTSRSPRSPTQGRPRLAEVRCSARNSPWFSPFDWGRKQWGGQFCSSSTRIVYVLRPLQRPVPTFLKECYYRRCSTPTKWSVSPSRRGDHRQYSDMDWRIFHVLPPLMEEITTTLPQSSTGNAAILHLVDKSHGPGRSRQYPPVPFSKGFHGLSQLPRGTTS